MKPYKFLFAAVAAVASMSAAANAMSFDIFSLDTNSDPDAPASWFSVDLVVNPGGTATFSLSNLVATGNSTKISTIYMGAEGYFFGYFAQGTGSLSYSGAMNFSLNETPPTSNGPAAWDVEVLGKSSQGNNAATINPGETLNITYALTDITTSEQDLYNAFYSDPQELGIAFHVQSLPGGYSEKYEALPTPTVGVPDGGNMAILLGASLLGLAGLRRAITIRKK